MFGWNSSIQRKKEEIKNEKRENMLSKSFKKMFQLLWNRVAHIRCEMEKSIRNCAKASTRSLVREFGETNTQHERERKKKKSNEETFHCVTWWFPYQHSKNGEYCVCFFQISHDLARDGATWRAPLRGSSERDDYFRGGKIKSSSAHFLSFKLSNDLKRDFNAMTQQSLRLQ